MNIHQLSVRHDQTHDRLLVSVNTTADEELKFWLTRRLMVRLWPALRQLVADHFAVPPGAHSDGSVDLNDLDAQSKELLMKSQQEAALQGADFDTPYRADNLHRPLGDLPLLVTKIDMTVTDAQHLKLRLTEMLENPESKREFQMELSSELTFGLVSLLSQTLNQADWGLDTSGISGVEQDDGLCRLSQATRPHYLN